MGQALSMPDLAADRTRLPTRRRVMRGVAAVGVSCFAGAAYAFGVEPHFRLDVARYALSLPGWRGGPMKIVALADIHACEPWMPASRVRAIVAHANALKPDLVVLLGDYVNSLHRFREAAVPPADWGAALTVVAGAGHLNAASGHGAWPEGQALLRAHLAAAAA